jgi:ATP-dependent exoDNAse (exonuclease V) beta subunit
MITVHKAKGLEFPVVILADPTCPAAMNKPGRHIVPARRLWLQQLCGCAPVELSEAAAEELQRDRAEAVRLAYVAATRTRDLLVVPVFGDAPLEGWVEVLNPAIYPPEATKRSSSPAPGCPAFGDESVLDRGPKGKVPSGGSVRPGLHASMGDRPEIVWWDPAVLGLDVEEEVSLRQRRILESDQHGAAATASEENYARWKRDRDETLAQASRPSISVKTVTSLAREQPGVDHVQIERVPRSVADRPSGRRFGALVHSMLATVDLNCTRSDIEGSAALHGRLVDATPEEISAAATTVGDALSHPLMRKAAAASSGSIRREVPIMLRRDDDTLAEGVVDLAFLEAGPEFSGWTVVDFKTDLEIESGRAEYSAQVALYAHAIEKATNSAARGILLVI